MGATAKQKRTGRHLGLLICILVMFTVSPMVAAFRHGVLMLNIAGAAVVVSATYAVGSRRQQRLIIPAVGLSIVSITLTGWLSLRPSLPLMIASHTSLAVLTAFFVVSILGYVLREEQITADKIYAAICVYLLAGYGWAFAYALVDETSRGAFSFPAAVEPGDYAGRTMQLRYFSFVTLTTMGYGDIVPRSSSARTLATLEAVTGQLYLVALVGRLVGLHIVHSDAFSASRNRRKS